MPVLPQPPGLVGHQASGPPARSGQLATGLATGLAAALSARTATAWRCRLRPGRCPGLVAASAMTPRRAAALARLQRRSASIARRRLWLAIGLCGTASNRHAIADGVKEDEVLDVVDGDTVKLASGGRVRLIGVNTPETVAPKQKAGAPPDCFGPEASKFTKELLPKGTRVNVELDEGPTDRYGRGLVYLYRAKDGLFVNAELVKQGLARRMRIAPNVRYDAVFTKMEQEASAAGRGLWKACPVGVQSARAGAGGTAAKPPVAQGASPGDTKDCKDFATYGEAKSWFDTYFPSFGDVAKLDGDGDGKPCEGLLRKEKTGK